MAQEGIKIELPNLMDVQRAIREMNPAHRKKAIRHAHRTALRPVASAIRAGAPRGSSKKKPRFKTIKRRKTGIKYKKEINQKVAANVGILVTGRNGTGVGVSIRSNAFHARFLEKGTLERNIHVRTRGITARSDSIRRLSGRGKGRGRTGYRGRMTTKDAWLAKTYNILAPVTARKLTKDYTRHFEIAIQRAEKRAAGKK